MTEREDWVGRYRFHFDAEMERFWRERLAAQIPDEGTRSAAFAEVKAEAEGAEIEISAAGTVASRSRGEEFYRAALDFEGEVAAFDKPNGARVTLRRSDGGILAEEPGKPVMRFTRTA